MILVVVYVGAVAVLFLFVVMMLDINFSELRQGFLQYLPIGALIGLILLVELLLVVGSWSLSPEAIELATAKVTADSNLTNTEQLGSLLYTDYAYLFQAAGMILLVAMIGAIVLTHRQREGVKKQVIADQWRFVKSNPAKAFRRARWKSDLPITLLCQRYCLHLVFSGSS
jgi:NADH-quinone oxidoreductase subunit J